MFRSNIWHSFPSEKYFNFNVKNSGQNELLLFREELNLDALV